MAGRALAAAAAREPRAQRAVALAAVLADRAAAGAARQLGPAVAGATAAAGHQDAVGTVERADPDVRTATARTAATVRAAAAGPVAGAAGPGELAVPGRTGDSRRAHGELEGLAGGHGQRRAGLTTQSAGGTGHHRVRVYVAGGAAALAAVQVDVDRGHPVRDGEGVRAHGVVGAGGLWS
ncbi:hypothetical protein [Streptomyces noursei]|uniref:hypothetical protein n=1 Tax=Streptomyces noursei TaxID=1971 RepID=UPI00038409F9|nr:hypothetical protein [Streptomyces noursei]EPY93694.1 hypothetical protein K530_46555 [Streptomyces noursei CCRC 11814]